MALGHKTGGRVKGTSNKLTSTAKDTIAQCASMLEKNGKTLYEWVLKDEIFLKTWKPLFMDES